MIEIIEICFGWGGLPWITGDESTADILLMLEQLYAQMMGWC